MKSSIKRTAEAILALAAIGMLAALVVPWPQGKLTIAPGGERAQVPQAAAGDARRIESAPPDALLTLFVKKTPVPSAPRPARAPGSVEKKPVDAPWLNYLGYSSGADGKPLHFFKDTRTGRLIKLSKGETSGGWALVEIGESRFVLKNNDDLYIVTKR